MFLVPKRSGKTKHCAHPKGYDVTNDADEGYNNFFPGAFFTQLKHEVEEESSGGACKRSNNQWPDEPCFVPSWIRIVNTYDQRSDDGKRNAPTYEHTF